MSNSVILPYDPLWKALEWAKAHCKSYITNQGVANSGPTTRTVEIEYYFSDPRDATLFRLMWAK